MLSIKLEPLKVYRTKHLFMQIQACIRVFEYLQKHCARCKGKYMQVTHDHYTLQSFKNKLLRITELTNSSRIMELEL